jgi:hypothetical protein
MQRCRCQKPGRIAPTHYSQILGQVILGAFSRNIQIFCRQISVARSSVARSSVACRLAVIGGFGLLTMVREDVRLGTVRWNPFSRTRL